MSMMINAAREFNGEETPPGDADVRRHILSFIVRCGSGALSLWSAGYTTTVERC